MSVEKGGRDQSTQGTPFSSVSPKSCRIRLLSMIERIHGVHVHVSAKYLYCPSIHHKALGKVPVEPLNTVWLTFGHSTLQCTVYAMYSILACAYFHNMQYISMSTFSWPLPIYFLFLVGAIVAGTISAGINEALLILSVALICPDRKVISSRQSPSDIYLYSISEVL